MPFPFFKKILTIASVVLVSTLVLSACTPWSSQPQQRKTEVEPVPSQVPSVSPTTPSTMMGKEVTPLSSSTEVEAIEKDLSATKIEVEDFSDL